MTEAQQIAAWLRGEADAIRAAAHKRATGALLYADAAILAERAKTLDLTAAAIERGEHMEGSSDGE